MAQLNIYVPNSLEKALRLLAKKRRRSLSAVLADILQREVTNNAWSDDFFKSIVGRWQGELSSIERQPAEDRELWA